MQNTCRVTEPFHWANAIQNGVKMYYVYTVYMIHPLRLYACMWVLDKTFSILLGIISTSHSYCPCLVPLYWKLKQTGWLSYCRSVVMCLQLLPKLFNSFQQFLVSNQGPHWVTSWANKELNMMDLFFANLVLYMESISSDVKRKNALYTCTDEVQGRLQFLSSLFSTDLSSADFSKCFCVSLTYCT